MHSNRIAPLALLAIATSTHAQGPAPESEAGQSAREASSAAPDGRWPSWRGPSRNGAADSDGLPTRWSAEENVLWRVAMPDWGGATPAVWDDRLFLLSPSKADPAAVAAHEEQLASQRRRRFGSGRHPGGDEMLLLCLRTADGEELWRRTLDEGNELHMKGNHASPSPVVDGERVWTVTGNGTVNAHTFDGELLWSFDLQEEWGDFGLMWGYASSPVLHEGLLVVQVLHGFRTDDPSYVAAFDALTGEVRWRVERPTDAPKESPDAYTTPLVIERGGKRELVVTGGDVVTGHDPASGKELWRVAGLNPREAGNYRIVPSAVQVGDVLVAPTRQRPLLGVKLVAEGVPTNEDVAWRWDDRGGPDVPTPTTDGERLFMVDDAGLVTCVDGQTGEAVWGPERTIEGTVSASPLLADGKLYVTNEEGMTVVLRAGDEFEQLAVNELDGSYTLSSPIAVGDRIYVRTGDFLYCIANAKRREGSGD